MPFIPLPQVFLLSMTLYGTEYPFGKFGSAIPTVSLLDFSQLNGERQKGKNSWHFSRKSFDAVQTLLSNRQNTDVLSTLLVYGYTINTALQCFYQHCFK